MVLPKIKGGYPALGIFFAVLAAMPLIIGEYRLTTLLLILIWTIAAVSYRLLATTGEFSLGHVVVMAIGAYSSAIMSRNMGMPFWITLPLGGLIAAGFAAATARPLFRMKGFYFLLGSFALGEAIRLCFRGFKVPFGGEGGFWYVPTPSIGSFTFSSTFSYYFLTLGITAACLFVMYRIDQSRIGKALVAIHSQDSLCESLGINILGYKTLAYITASFFAGIAGALLGHYMTTVSPPQFAIGPMLLVLVWVVVGGTNTFWGPIAGVFTLYLIQEQLRGVLVEWLPMFYGIILIAMVFALPGGLESLPTRIREWRRARRGKLAEVG
ncbi:MAG: branched-chain amino acid ABC transporter permease [Dehalococcoidales bacterium]